MTRFLTMFLLVLAAIRPVHAADFSIMPLPRHLSDMKVEDYLEALQLSRDHAPGQLIVSLWAWSKLEPDEGDNIIKKEVGGINYAMKTHGFVPYVGITVIDTVNRMLPEDLEDLKWDDPKLIIRYGQILDVLKQELGASPAYFVIANEADVHFEKHADEFPAFLKFVAAAKREVRQRFPKAVIGVSGTYEGYNKGGVRAGFVRDLIAASDVAFFTYYPVFDLKPAIPKMTPGHLDAMIAAAGSKPVVLQEVGYPSSIKGSSPQAQAEFFSVIIPAINSRPRIIVASLFGLHDFDEKTCDMLGGYYGFGGLIGMTSWVKDFKLFLCSLGLRDSEGNPKPAWEATQRAFALIKARP